MNRIGIIGAGAWGTALAVIVNRVGCHVTLWSRNPAVIDTIRRRNVNTMYLPDIFLDPEIVPTLDVAEACHNDALLLAVPAQYMRTVCIALSNHLDASVPVVICSKGIERGSLELMSEVVHDVLPGNPVAVLSGPNFSREAAKGLPTATTIACADRALGEQIMYALGSSMFRPYYTDDVIGAQIGGAVKNVIAVACGVTMARDMGQNALAALITRAVAEIRRLCLAKGGREETLLGLSGIGDLMLTCSSLQSRNTSLGYALGKGERLDDILARQTSVSEGVATSESVISLARQLKVEMPICQVVHAVLRQSMPVDEAIFSLMERPFGEE